VTQTPDVPSSITPDITITVVAGLVYLAAIEVGDWILPHVFGIPPVATVLYLRSAASHLPSVMRAFGCPRLA